MNRRIFEHFGIQKKGFYVNELFKLHSTDIKNAILDNDMLAIVGPVGAGKTFLFNNAILNVQLNPDKKPIFVYVRNFYKEKINIGGIINAIIYDISSESPRRDLEARSRQVIRLLGTRFVEEGRRVCVIIEEAHRLHSNTLRALKELRESNFAGISPLFSVILIGHPELAVKLQQRKEAYWRSQIIYLDEGHGWMQFSDRVQYLKHVYGEAITQKARQRIATLYRVPLEMNFFVENKMVEAFRAGLKQLTEDAFEASPAEIKEALNLSLAEIAREAGLGKTTVHNVLTGQNVQKSAAVKAAMERLAEKRAGINKEAV